MSNFDETGITTVEISIEGMHCESCVASVREALGAERGVEMIDVSVGRAQVGFVPQIVSKAYIESLIEQQGYQIKREVEKKGVFGRFIDRMIASNQKNFGNDRLDCCNLSSNTSTKKGRTHHDG